MRHSLFAGHSLKSAKVVQSSIPLSVQGWFKKQLSKAVQKGLEVCAFVAATVRFCRLTCNTDLKLVAELLQQVDML